MVERRDGLVDLAHKFGPCSVRHIYYQATVVKLPGITKEESGYDKVQRLLVELRRAERIPYRLIVDNTRWVRRARTFDSVEDCLASTAATYRRNLWTRSPWRVEVWAESDSIASTIADITQEWTVDLLVTKGQSSDTFTYSAGEAWKQDRRTPMVLYIGDHDPAGLHIERVLIAKLAEHSGLRVGPDFAWQRIGVTWAQVEQYDLPGTKPKRAPKAHPYEYDRSVEAEALDPRVLRALLDNEIQRYVDAHEYEQLLIAEEEERSGLHALAAAFRGGAA